MKVKENYKKMRVHYDRKADILYLVIRQGTIDDTVEIVSGVQAELDKKNELIGLEIQGASRFFKPVLKPLESRAVAR